MVLRLANNWLPMFASVADAEHYIPVLCIIRLTSGHLVVVYFEDSHRCCVPASLIQNLQHYRPSAT